MRDTCEVLVEHFAVGTRQGVTDTIIDSVLLKNLPLSEINKSISTVLALQS